MADLKLTLACWDYDRTRPLMDGRVKPEGIDLDIKVLRPRETFQRMLDRQEFQVSELSLASYTALKGRGACPFMAVPVALSKIFRHSCIYVRTDAGIETPAGPARQARRHLAVELDRARLHARHAAARLRRRDRRTCTGSWAGSTRFAEPPLIPLNLPKDIKLDFSPAGQTLEQMFEAGELDALLSIYIPKLFLDGSPSIARLFPNYKEVEQDYYRRTQHLSDHAHRGAARGRPSRSILGGESIYRAFLARRAISRSTASTTPTRCASLCRGSSITSRRRWRVFGKDFWAYGLEPNRPTFEAVGRYVYEQGLSPRVVTPEELFPVSVD